MKYIFSLLLICVMGFQSYGQKATDLLLEWQQYPTGSIPGLRFETSLSNKSSLILKLGYNTFNHKDLGVHAGEQGNGYGFTIGYKSYFKPDHKGWSIALKNDVWWNKVDWFDNDQGTIITGETSIVVIQPTAELGYTILLGSGVVLTPHIALGIEWNVQTKGEPTGEGLILLGGVGIGKRF